MKISRLDLIDFLMRKRHNGPVKIITGIRRCGKSYLISTLFKEKLLAEGVDNAHVIEIPLDRDDFKPYRDAIKLGDYIRSQLVRDGRWNYVFIDEIQLTRKILPPDVDLKRIAPEDRAPGKLYIQAAYALPSKEKREQELLPAARPAPEGRGEVFRGAPEYQNSRRNDETR